MKIEQTAGDFRVTVSADGHPLWPKVSYLGGEEMNLSIQGLYDLRYCIDRVLAQLPDGKK